MTFSQNIVPSPNPQPVLLPQRSSSVWGPWATIGFTLVILIVFLVAQGIVVAIPALSALSSHTGTFSTTQEITRYIMDQINARLGLYQAIATIVSGIAGVLMIWVFVNARKGVKITEYLALKKIKIKTIILAFAITFAAIFLADLILSALGSNNPEPVTEKLYSTSVLPWLFWISVVVFAPLFEEALFRGFLYEGLARSWGAYVAVMLTAFGWSVLHGVQYQVGPVIYIFLLGLAMGIVRWKTKSIWPTFIMHATVNLVASIALATNLKV